MLTLRQIEVIRAITVTGTVGGAARLLDVSSPGISRVMTHAETIPGLKLFSRRHRRYTPSPEARDVFNQGNTVYDKVGDLQYVIRRLSQGRRLRAAGRFGAQHFQRPGAARHRGRAQALPQPFDRISDYDPRIARLFLGGGLPPAT